MRMEGSPVSLHVDTGTEVTVIIEQTWKAIGQPALSRVGQSLRGPDSTTFQQIHRYTQAMAQLPLQPIRLWPDPFLQSDQNAFT